MNYTEQQLTAAVVSDGLRPALGGIQSMVPESLSSLIKKCWDGEPQNRPSFDDIIVELASILKDREKEQNISSEQHSRPCGEDQMIETSHPQTYRESINWSTRGEHSSVASFDARLWDYSSADDLTYRPTLSWGSFATCGRRESMEDTHFLLPRMHDQKDVHFFGIFDGHRGNHESQACLCFLM